MSNFSRRSFFHGSLIFIILVASFIVDLAPGAAKPADNRSSSAGLNQESSIFLPLVFRYRIPIPGVFGAETFNLNSTNIDRMNQVGVYWVRSFLISWADIEPVRTDPPTYHWEKVNETGVINAAAKGFEIIGTIKYTPAWAQYYPGVVCGPIAPAALGAFAQFMTALVQRYNLSPYRVKYWEIGNEPDVDPKLVDPDSGFGCWGNDKDKYYGGGYYATMLKSVYPWVKAADPQTNIIIGGLLLDCDPTLAPPPGKKNCNSSKFLTGILKNGGGSYFDIVGFHAFANYTGQISENIPNWTYRGGVLLGKISYLNQVLANYNVSKPLLLDETALVCPEWMGSVCTPVPSDDFLEKQADYVVWLYVRSWAYGLKGAVWFTIEDSGWRSSGLSLGGTPKPAYRAYQFITQELGNAVYSKPIGSYGNVAGFEFRSGDKLIWALWSADQLDHSITLPSNTTRVFNKYGAVLTPQNLQITVNSPIYVELTP